MEAHLAIRGAHEALLQSIELNNAIENKERDAHFRQLIDAISKLSYRAYLLVEHIFHEMREDRQVENYASLIKNLNLSDEDLMKAKNVNDAFEKLSGSSKAKDDIVLLIRMISPFGKNIVNKTLDPNKPIAVDARQNYKLKTGKTTYFFVPSLTGGIVILLKDSEKNIILEDGQYVFLGRNFSCNRLFDIELAERITINSSLPPKHDSVSRIGIMIGLRDNMVFVLDRGSRLPILLTGNGRSILYEPNITGLDGTMGNSQERTI